MADGPELMAHDYNVDSALRRAESFLQFHCTRLVCVDSTRGVRGVWGVEFELHLGGRKPQHFLASLRSSRIPCFKFRDLNYYSGKDKLHHLEESTGGKGVKVIGGIYGVEGVGRT